MKSILFVFTFSLVLSLCSFSHAQVPAASPAAIVVTTITAPTPVPTVQVAEPAAPPAWAIDLMMTAQNLPVVGPYISKALLYLGILSAILTSLIAFLLTAISALTGILNVAGLVNLATKLQIFRDGKVMYWLKFLSMFNAKKPESKPMVVSNEAPKQAA